MSDAPASSVRWYAVHVRSNQERNTVRFLEDRGVALFFPQYRVRSIRRDRRVTLTRPLFAGYLFVQLDLASPDRLSVLRAPGAVRLVGFAEGPEPIPDEVIASLKILVGEGGDEIMPHPLVQIGERVTVVDGPFRGASGVLSENAGRKRKLVVQLEFLGRAVAVPIDLDQVAPISR